MPPYPAYGVDPSTTAFPEATTATEPVASSSALRWYAADYHHPLPATGAYVIGVPGYATLSGLRKGPESCRSSSRGSGRSSNRSLTRSEIKKALRGATSELVGDRIQEIPAELEPLIPPQASPTIVGVSPHRLQANYLVAGLTNTLGSLKRRPMSTPAVIPRSPFIPRTAKPPYSHRHSALSHFELSKKENQCVDQDSQQNHRFHDSSKLHYRKVHAVQRFAQVRQTIRFRPHFCLETSVFYQQDLHWHGFSLLVTILHDAPFLLQILLKMENTDVKTPDYFEVQDTKAEWKTMNLTSLKKKLPSTVRMLSTNSSKVHDLRDPSVPPSLSKESFKDLNGFTTHIFTTGSQHAFSPPHLSEYKLSEDSRQTLLQSALYLFLQLSKHVKHLPHHHFYKKQKVFCNADFAQLHQNKPHQPHNTSPITH